jgi:hypothetical protein
MIGYDTGTDRFAGKYLRSVDLKSQEGSGKVKIKMDFPNMVCEDQKWLELVQIASR